VRVDDVTCNICQAPPRGELQLADHVTSLRAAAERHAVQRGAPQPELGSPVRNGGERRHNQDGPAEKAQRARGVHEHGGLDRLAETHLVAEDGALLVVGAKVDVESNSKAVYHLIVQMLKPGAIKTAFNCAERSLERLWNGCGTVVERL